MERIIHKGRVGEEQQDFRDVEYWLSRPSVERISAVETLRRQYHGETGRLRRTVRITKQA
jgi:hypothetical protein